MFTNSKIKILLQILIVLSFVTFVSYLFINQYLRKKEYINSNLNGIIEEVIQTRSGYVIKFKNKVENVDLHIDNYYFKYLKKGDTIKKPSNSKYVYLFKRDTTYTTESPFLINDY